MIINKYVEQISSDNDMKKIKQEYRTELKGRGGSRKMSLKKRMFQQSLKILAKFGSKGIVIQRGMANINGRNELGKIYGSRQAPRDRAKSSRVFLARLCGIWSFFLVY